MELPSIDSLQEQAEKQVGFLKWLAEQLRKKSWVTLLMVLNSVLIAFGNQKMLPLLIDSIRGGGYFEAHQIPQNYWIYWLITIGVIFLIAFIITYITLPKPVPPSLALSERSAIKGLIAFGYSDAELFERLGRTRMIRDLLNALCDPAFRFGILSGESGCGKSSFLQAGIWPRLAARDHRALYVQCNDRQPLESIQYAIHEQCNIPYEQLQTEDLAELLTLATTHPQQAGLPATLILILDQFEQFFTHQRFKEDRKPFIEALSAWYRQQPPHPVKILVSLRSDLFGRMIELQNALGYTLGPNQNFMLEKFEPSEAATVFRAIIEPEKIECDEAFITDLCADELANPRDGLVSPVDLQILAWMIADRNITESGRFDRTAFQRFGGLEKLLNRFLKKRMDACVLDEQRQAVLKVLLALIDLENNLRAGVLTEAELQQKLTASLDPDEVTEALQWLIRPDVRLVNPRAKGAEHGFELAHERIIPAIRALVGPILTEVDQANQLLNRRVNEWLGNERAARYLLSWRELRSILKQKPYLVWQPGERQKKELIKRSRQRYHYGLAGIAGVLLLGAVGYWLSFLPQVQMWRVKHELVELNELPRKPELQHQSALALAAYGAWNQSIDIVNRIDVAEIKAYTIQALAKSAVELKEPSKALPLIDKLHAATEGIDLARYKSQTSRVLSRSAIKLKKRGKATARFDNALLKEAKDEYAKYEAQMFQDRVKSAAELKEPAKELVTAAALFKQLKEVNEGTDDTWTKAHTIGALAQSAVELKEPVKATELLDKVLVTAEGIDDPGPKAYILQALTESAITLEEPGKSAMLLDKLLITAERMDDTEAKTETFEVLVNSAVKLKEPGKTADLLDKLLVIAEGGDYSHFKSRILLALTKSAVKLKKSGEATELLNNILVVANTFDSAFYEAEILQALAWRATDLKEPGKANELLNKLHVAAERLEKPSEYKAETFQTLAWRAVRLKQPDKAAMLFGQAQMVADEIVDARYKAKTLKAFAQIVNRSSFPIDKTLWLNRLNHSTATVADSEKKDEIWVVLSEQAAQLGNWSQAREFADQIRSASHKIDALSRILQAWGADHTEAEKEKNQEVDG